jgi:hypothetical protein
MNLDLHIAYTRKYKNKGVNTAHELEPTEFAKHVKKTLITRLIKVS